MNGEEKAFLLKVSQKQEELEKHLMGLTEIQVEGVEMMRMLREMQETKNMTLWAHFDALVFFVSEMAGMDHDSLTAILRKKAKEFMDLRLTKLENTQPEFAARVQAWVDGNFPSFPFGEPLPDNDFPL